MLPIILIAIYIIGVIIWMKIEKKYFPYKEEDYTIEFDGAHEITSEMHNNGAIFRSIIWPFTLTVILVFSIIVLFDEIFEIMKEITIKVPDNCELKQDGNTYSIVEKEKKLTYDDISNKLFSRGNVYFTSANGNVITSSSISIIELSNRNNAKSKRQLEKLLAINKLMNVAKYLNGDWQPDWDCRHEKKYYFCVEDEQIKILYTDTVCCIDVLFKSIKLAKQAIEILGEETIKLALCTDY